MSKREKKLGRSVGVKARAFHLERMTGYTATIASGRAEDQNDPPTPISLEVEEYHEGFVDHGGNLQEIAELDPSIPAATFEESVAANGVIVGKVTYVRKCILRFVHDLTIAFEDAALYFESHDFHPYEACYQEAVSQTNRFSLKDALLKGNTAEKREGVKSLNLLISTLQKAMRADSIRQLLRNYRRNSQQRYKKLLKTVNDIFSRHSRLLSVRVDFAYSRAALDGAGSSSPPSAHEASAHRRKIVDYITKKYGDGLAMYAWSMECGLLSGIHFHFWLLLKGSDHREDFGIAEHLGKHWMTEVTEGRGRYYNCSAAKASYLVCGLGMLHRDSQEAMEGVKIIASYITKLDFHLRYQKIGIRTFGRSDERRLNKKRRTKNLIPKGA